MAIQKPHDSRVDLNDLIDTSYRIEAVLESVREGLLAPDSVKTPPTFSTAQLGEICELDKSQMDYQIKKNALPSGQVIGNGRRSFTLKESRIWAREMRSRKMKPSEAEAITITVANFKGGVTKTTTAVTLAQGLSRRGHSVLMIDSDPQGSMTTLMGIRPNLDVSDEQTLLPLCTGDEVSLEYAIQETYWPGIDIVPAAMGLHHAEFELPVRQMSNSNFEFWNVLQNGIDTARTNYDVIIIDTPPSLSYVTLNALFAADGLIMPLPPHGLDFASSGQFWNLFNDLAKRIITNRGSFKKFDFVNVLLSRVEALDSSVAVVREWIKSAYLDMVMSCEIPKTTFTASASAEFGTVYDAESALLKNPRTYKRALNAYENMVELIEQQIQMAWARRVAGEKS